MGRIPTVHSSSGLAAAVAVVLAPGPALAVSFDALPFPGLATFSESRDISSDAGVVVGYSVTGTQSAATRWVGGVPSVVASQPGGFDDVAISDDGAVVVGTTNAFGTIEAFRWQDGNLIPLGLGGGSQSSARGVSGDGSVVVGSVTAGFVTEAFRWEAGVMQGLGQLPGYVRSRALGVSGDGSVIVGVAFSSGTLAEAFRWEAGTMVGLGDIPSGITLSSASAVSDDGSVIVGFGTWGTSNGRIEAVRWDDTVMTELGFLSGDDQSEALDVTPDGVIVVGYSQASFTGNTDAVIWDEQGRPLPIQAILEYAGIDLDGWTLSTANAVAADGRTVVGTGWNPDGDIQGWIAELPPVLVVPEPSTALLVAAGLMVLGVRRRPGAHGYRKSF